MADLESRNALVCANLGLAGKVARDLWNRVPDMRRIWTLEDTFQVACLGLIHAAELFDPSRGYPFATYAFRAMHNRIIRDAMDSGLIRIPNHHLAALLGKKPPGTHTEEARQALHYQFLPDRLGEEVLARDCDRPAWEEFEELGAAIARLSEEDRWLLGKRFGLDGSNPQTLAAIGKELGLTRERIRQKLVKVYVRLRRELVSGQKQGSPRSP